MTTQNPFQPIDLFFEPIIESYLSKPRFLRRDWLAAEVDTRLGTPGCRFVLLTAEPGAGKSAFIAQLAADHPPVTGKPAWLRYFLRRDQRTPLGDVGAHSFLLRIGFQLAARFPEAFAQENLELAVQQRIGIAQAGSEVVGAEVKRIVASPFYRKVLTIQQEIAQSGGRVVGLRMEELVVESQLLDLSQLVNMAIVDPARALLKLHPDDRIVILVDALDETRYHDTQDNILEWLTNCPELPPNVRFVLSSRPSDTALLTFCEKQKPYLQALTIRPDDAHVQDDARAYVHKLVARPDIAQEVARAGQTVQGFADQATAKARGNLGYLDALARAVDSALARTDDQGRATLSELLTLRDLPDEIEGLYAFFLRQIKTAVARERVELTDPETGESYDMPVWEGVYRKILGVLVVAMEPLTLSQIAEYGRIDAKTEYVYWALERLPQFLVRSENRYQLFHQSLAEFLTSPKTREQPETADLFIDAGRWHNRICSLTLAKLGL